VRPCSQSSLLPCSDICTVYSVATRWCYSAVRPTVAGASLTLTHAHFQQVLVVLVPCCVCGLVLSMESYTIIKIDDRILLWKFGGWEFDGSWSAYGVESCISMFPGGHFLFTVAVGSCIVYPQCTATQTDRQTDRIMMPIADHTVCSSLRTAKNGSPANSATILKISECSLFSFIARFYSQVSTNGWE